MTDLPLHPLCTLDTAKKSLRYDALTGEFERVVRTSSRAQLGRVGRLDRHGHARITVAGHEIAAHRLAWLWVNGAWPCGDIDHTNGDRADNRIANLRDVPHRVNMENRRLAAGHNKSGVLGVTRRGWSYLARIKISGRQVCLGSFSSAEAAHAAYLAAKRQSHAGCTL